VSAVLSEALAVAAEATALVVALLLAARAETMFRMLSAGLPDVFCSAKNELWVRMVSAAELLEIAVITIPLDHPAKALMDPGDQ
jgi:hypothetical protein